MPENSNWVILDMSYLAYRAHFTTGLLSFQEQQTGVIFGFLRELHFLTQRFDTNNIVFAFDSKRNLRKEMYSRYKENRNQDPLMVNARNVVKSQIELLRGDILPGLGRTNLFLQPGYEADDIIALAAKTIKEYHTGNIFMVSKDNDLLQLLDGRTQLYYRENTWEKFIDVEYMKSLYDIGPKSWVRAKAIAGCKSDNIPGISGVGEKTAGRFLRGKLNKTTQAYAKCKRWVDYVPQYNVNIELIELPFIGAASLDGKIYKQEPIDKMAWQKTLDRFGIKTLSNDFDQLQARSGIPNRRKHAEETEG